MSNEASPAAAPDYFKQTADKLSSMQKYISAGRKVTSRQYEEVLNGASKDVNQWLQLITQGVKGGYFDLKTTTKFLSMVTQLSHAEEIAAIVSNNPKYMDSILYRRLVEKLIKLDASPEMVQSVISSRKDLDLGDHLTWSFYNKYEAVKKSTEGNLGIELGFIYHLSKENNKAEVAEKYKKLRENHPDYVPDLVTFTRIAHALGPPLNNWPLMWSLVQSLLTSDVPRDVLFYNVALRALTYCDEPDDADLRYAQELLAKMRADGLKPNRDSYLALMDIFFRNGRAHKGVEMLQTMKADGVEVDKTIVSRFVKELIIVKQPELAFDVLSSAVVNDGVRNFRTLYPHVEDAFMREGKYLKAAEIRRIYEKSKTTELGGELEKAITKAEEEESEQKKDRGMAFIASIRDSLTKPTEPGSDISDLQMTPEERHAHIIQTHYHFRRWDKVITAYEEMQRDEQVKSTDVFTTSKCVFALANKNPAAALEWLEKTEQPHPAAFHNIIRGIVTSHVTGKIKNIFIAIAIARKKSINWFKSTFDLIIKVAGGKIKLKEYIEKMKKKNILDDSAFKYIVQGSDTPDKAKSQLKELMPPEQPVTLGIHNALLQLHMEAGECDRAISYFGEMRSRFASPNIQTYDILVCGLMKYNRFAEALAIFGDLMHKSAPFPPSTTMVTSIVRHILRNEIVREKEIKRKEAEYRVGKTIKIITESKDIEREKGDLEREKGDLEREKMGDGGSGDLEREKMGDGGMMIFRILRDVRGRHVVPSVATYESILRHVLADPSYSVTDLKWVLAHAKGDEVELNWQLQRKIERRLRTPNITGSG